jgi:short-subunit dehydrogenase
MATALITGGTSGIGAAFARALATRHYNLVLVARNCERLTQLSQELHRRYGIAVDVLPADLARRDEVLTVAERVAADAEPIDLLINNAGFGVGAKLLDAGVASHELSIDVMIRAVLILSNAAGRAMRSRGRGGIINVSSFAGYVSMGSYSAIKAWVTSFTEALAGELHGSGVAVTALCPGWVRTEFHSRAEIDTSPIPGALWMQPDALVTQALNDFDHGRVISMPTMRYKILYFLVRHSPPAALRAVSRMMASSRKEQDRVDR